MPTTPDPLPIVDTSPPKPPPDDAYYHCGAEWHLARLVIRDGRTRTPFAAIIHPFALRLCSKQARMFNAPRLFYCSAVRLAEHFGVERHTILDAIHALRDAGWFIRTRQGTLSFPVVYEVLNHDEWAAAHPGQCCEKAGTPYDAEAKDALGQRLYTISGGRVSFYKNHLTALRATGLPDDVLADKWADFYNTQRAGSLRGKPFYRFLEHLRGLPKFSLLGIRS